MNVLAGIIILLIIAVCLMVALPSLGAAAKEERSDCVNGGLIFLVIAVIFIILFASIDIYPTCTLEGLIK